MVDVSGMSQACVRHVSGVYQACFGNESDMYQRDCEHASGGLLESVRRVPDSEAVTVRVMKGVLMLA